MRLSPPEPSMLEARNAILQADTANGGDLHDIIWSAFAHRGMGYYASAFDGNDTHPAEDFNTPPADGAPQGTAARAASSTRRPACPLAGARVRLGAATDSGGNARSPTPPAPTGATSSTASPRAPTASSRCARAAAATTRSTSPKLVVRGGETTTKDVPLDRNWVSLPGGARTLSSNDDTFDARRLRARRADRRRRRRLRLGGEQPELAGLSGRPAAATRRWRRSRCRSRSTSARSRSTRRRAASSSAPRPACGTTSSRSPSDGTTFRTSRRARSRRRQAGTLIRLEPTGAAGKNVKQVRLTMIQSCDQGEGCTGARLHQRLAARGVRRGAERAARRLADRDAGDRGAGRR